MIVNQTSLHEWDMLLCHPITGPHIKGSVCCIHAQTVLSIVVVSRCCCGWRSLHSSVYRLCFGHLPNSIWPALCAIGNDAYCSVWWAHFGQLKWRPRVLGNVNALRLPLTTIHLSRPQMLTIMQRVHCVLACSYQQVNTHCTTWQQIESLAAEDHLQLQITLIWAPYTKAKAACKNLFIFGLRSPCFDCLCAQRMAARVFNAI